MQKFQGKIELAKYRWKYWWKLFLVYVLWCLAWLGATIITKKDIIAVVALVSIAVGTVIWAIALRGFEKEHKVELNAIRKANGMKEVT